MILSIALCNLLPLKSYETLKLSALAVLPWWNKVNSMVVQKWSKNRILSDITKTAKVTRNYILIGVHLKGLLTMKIDEFGLGQKIEPPPQIG